MSDGRERPDRRSDDDAAGLGRNDGRLRRSHGAIRPQAPNAVKRGDGQPEDGREWREPMASVVDQPIIDSPLEEPGVAESEAVT